MTMTGKTGRIGDLHDRKPLDGLRTQYYYVEHYVEQMGTSKYINHETYLPVSSLPALISA